MSARGENVRGKSQTAEETRAGAPIAGCTKRAVQMVIERPEEQEPRFAAALDRRSPIPKAIPTPLAFATPSVPGSLPPMRAPLPTISIDVDVEWDHETRESPSVSAVRPKLESTSHAPRASRASRETFDSSRWKRVPPDPASRVRRWLSEDF